MNKLQNKDVVAALNDVVTLLLKDKNTAINVSSDICKQAVSIIRKKRKRVFKNTDSNLLISDIRKTLQV